MAVDKVTQHVISYIDLYKTNIAALSKEIGVSYGKLRRSLVLRNRNLLAHEFLAICNYLDLDPYGFYQDLEE